MSEAIAEAFVRLRADASGFAGDVRRQIGPSLRQTERDLARTNREFGRFGRGALVGTGALGGLGRAAAFASGSFLGGAGLVFATKSVINAASDLNEEVNKTRVVFGAQGREVVAWSKQSAQAFGLSQQQALAAAGAFGAMLETSGLAEQQASTMSETLVKLAADMASFNNQDPSDMLDRLRSGLAGEAEPLRQFGILLSDTRVQQEAYRLGIAAVGSTLTDQQKVQARYSILFKDTARQQGDFARTSDGLANTMRKLRAAVANTEATIGKAFLPTVLNAANALNDWLANPANQARIQRGAEHTAEKIGTIGTAIGKLNRGGELIQDSLTTIFTAPLSGIPYFHDKMESARRDMRGLGDDADTTAVSVGNVFSSVNALTFSPRPDDRAGPQGAGPSTSFIPASLSGTFAAAKPLSTGIPWLDNLLAVAEGNSGRGDDEKIIARAIRVLRGRLGKATNLGIRTDLQNAINAYVDRLSSLEAQDAQAVQDAIDKRREKADKIKAGRQAGRDALADLAASLQAQAEQAATRRAAMIDSLTQVPEGLALEEQIAEQRGAGEEKLNAIRQKEVKALEGRIRQLHALHASRVKILEATLNLATLNHRIRDVAKKDAADSGTRTDIFEQAAREFELYGSNIGPPAQLSGQGARGTVAGNILAGAGKSVTVIQNFLRGEHSVGQALQQAHQAATALR